MAQDGGVMNQDRFFLIRFYLGFVVFLILTGVGCSTFKGLNRQIAGFLDMGLIFPKGEVILFYKEGSLITVKECVDLTILKEPSHRADCTQKPGTYKAQVSVTEFKNRLNAVLRLPVGNYTSLMKQKIEAYNKQKGQLDRAVDLKRHQSEINSKIDRIKAFMDEEYGKENEYLEAQKAQLETQLAGIKQKLASNDVSLTDATVEVNQSIEDLIHKIVESRSLTFVYSQHETSFEFNILKSYVDYPGIYNATFAQVKAGTFLMGSPSDEVDRYDDEIQHKVTLTQDFEIQTTEVTQLQYFLVMGYNPSSFKKKRYCLNEHRVINREELCPNHPVEYVSWNDVQGFISKLNKGEDGYTYGLPTEAQWEYAARGCVGSGELDFPKSTDMASCTKTAFNLGYNISPDQVNYDGNYPYNNGAKGEYREQTVKVSSLANANGLGLYDIHGNVSEWVVDRYEGYSSSHVIDPKGSTSDPYRMGRGGSWNYKALNVRSATRYGWSPGFRNADVGLRLMRTAKK